MTEEKTIVLEVDRETLAREYQAHGYPSYADLAREGEGSFTLCSLRAVAIARSQAIDDCIKAVRDALEPSAKRGRLLDRLESLKSPPPPEQGGK